MATWYIRPLPAGGWQVLTPTYTQACALCPDQDAALRAACTRVADEGGGTVAIYTEHGQLTNEQPVAASSLPYWRGLSPSG